MFSLPTKRSWKTPSLNIVNIVVHGMDVKLENTADHRQASDQLTQSSRYYQIRYYQAQNSLYWYGVSTAIFLLCSSSGARPCIFKCWGQVWSWLKNYPNYIWTRSFWSKAKKNGCIDLFIGHIDCVGIGQNKTVEVHESICLWILYWYSVDYYS